jgi:hypothetical protein
MGFFAMAKTNRAHRATAITATALAVVGGVAVTVAPPVAAFAATGTARAVAAVPVVSSLSPTTGDAGGGTAVSVAGSGFKTIDPGNPNAVMFGSTPADRIVILSDTRLIAVSPPGTGTVVVRVTGGDGASASTSARFGFRTRLGAEFVDAPARSSGGTDVIVEVTGGTVGASSSAFTALRITAKVGGVAATRVAWVDETHVKVTTPATTRALPVSLQLIQDGYAGPESTAKVAYYPTVSAVSPSSVPADEPITVEITGTGFLAVDEDDPGAVTLGGVPVTSFDVQSATEIIADLPADAAGTSGVLQVTTPGGSTPEAEAPTVIHRGPLAVDESGQPFLRASGGVHVLSVTGDTLSANAREFAAARISVRLGTTKLTPAYVDPTHFKITVPAQPGESAELMIQQDMLAGPVVTVPIAPVVTSMSVAGAPLAGGGTVQIKVAGAGSTSATDFLFGGNPAECTTTGVGASLTYVCTVPAASEVGPVWVSFTSGTGATSRFTAAATFSYTDID